MISSWFGISTVINEVSSVNPGCNRTDKVVKNSEKQFSIWIFVDNGVL